VSGSQTPAGADRRGAGHFRVLVVDDERSLRTLLTRILRDEGYEVGEAASAEAALEELERRAAHLVVTDLRLPGLDGIELLRRVRKSSPETLVIVITAFGTVASAVEAMKLGAVDYLTKPLANPDELRVVVREALARRRLADDAAALRPALGGLPLARDPAMQQVLELVTAVAPGEATVLITGESGTGKEVIARAVHALSPRASRPLVAVNCAALSETLLDSELFGHERGAFTGAHERRRGRFELADGSTLFLDEVGEMSPTLQAKLLRVLQEREFTRVGGSTLIRVDVRVIAATNRDLEQAMRQGRFREDLYYRIAVFPIPIPPLRARRGDILPLAGLFLEQAARRAGKTLGRFSPEAERALVAYAWPGNVRELMNVVERAVILERGDQVQLAHLAIQGTTTASPPPERLNLRELERDAILRALELTGGNRREAAELLGIGLRTLQYRLKEYAEGEEGGEEGGDGRGEG
jgi:two-component system response regulator FlrC